MFVLRQINSRINTSMISMSLICIMLLLTIGILSGAMSLSQSFNSDVAENNLNDVTLINNVTLGDENDSEEITDIKKQFEKDGFYLSDYLKEYTQYNIYSFKDSEATISNFLSQQSMDSLKKEYGNAITFDGTSIQFMKESEYNNLMELSGKSNLKVNLNDNEYVMTANFEKLKKCYNDSLKNDKIIKINGKDYVPKIKSCIEVAVQNSNMDSNLGIVIVKDNVIENSSNSLLVENDICGNYKVNDNKLEETDQKFLSEMKSFYKAHESEGLYRPCETVTTKVQVKASGVGISAILTFLGLYLGIIFSITSAAVLAIQQLSQSSDNKERYEVLRKIGAETKIINRSLFIQIAIYFMLPLSLALVHSVVGLSEVNKLISIFGHIDLTANIVITATFIILVYGGYFIATYMASKSIIKERERSE